MRWQRTRTTVMAKISRTLIPALALGVFLCAAAGPAGATGVIDTTKGGRGISLNGSVSGIPYDGVGQILYNSGPSSAKAAYTDSPLFFTSSFTTDPIAPGAPGANLQMGASQTSSFVPSSPTPFFTRFTAQGSVHVYLERYFENAEVVWADSFFDIYFKVVASPSFAQSFTLDGWLSADTSVWGGLPPDPPPFAGSSVYLERVGGPVIASSFASETYGTQMPFFYSGALAAGDYHLYGGSSILPPFTSWTNPGTAAMQDAAFSADFTLGPMVPVDVIPEPLTMAGLFFGLTGLGAYIRRRK